MIRSPDDSELDELCQRLSEMAGALDRDNLWPEQQLRLCADYAVYRWFMPESHGGFAWSDLDVTRGYLRLSAACLNTTFIITQRTGASRRIANCQNEALKQELLPSLTSGETFATVGISHLTTSHRHLAKPVLSAEEAPGGFLLNGFSPWVTGADQAQDIVLGAAMDDGRQLLAAVPTDLPGISVAEPVSMVGLSASHTGRVDLAQVFIPSEKLIAGPSENVMGGGVGAKSGGLQTSTLALGVARAAIDFLRSEGQKRNELLGPWENLHQEHSSIEADLLALSTGGSVCTNEELRKRANSLVLRSSQAALAAAKGAGYVMGHPAGRWCREALFFLVWSCPQPVMQANLCELAGIID